MSKRTVIKLALQALVVLLCVVNAFNIQPFVRVHYETNSPNEPWKVQAEAPLCVNDISGPARTEFYKGVRVYSLSCIREVKNDRGQYVFAYRTFPDGTWLGAESSNPEVQAYLRQRFEDMTLSTDEQKAFDYLVMSEANNQWRNGYWISALAAVIGIGLIELAAWLLTLWTSKRRAAEAVPV